MPDVEYKLFCCREEPTCGFKAQGKTDEEVVERARAHMTQEHGISSKEADDRIRRGIEPVRTDK
jgi:predicted small metal-binding protein